MSADIKTELPKPWGYARNVDGRIQISVGPDRPPCNERGSGYFTPWAAMYGGDMMIAYAERAVLEAAPASSAMVPDGFVLVPVEPTEEWIQAACLADCQTKFETYQDWWNSMLSGTSRHIRELLVDDYKKIVSSVTPKQQASDAGRQG